MIAQTARSIRRAECLGRWQPACSAELLGSAPRVDKRSGRRSGGGGAGSGQLAAGAAGGGEGEGDQGQGAGAHVWSASLPAQWESARAVAVGTRRNSQPHDGERGRRK